MADRSGIQWTDATWNPTVGCDRVSPGCDNCYAEGEVNRRHAAALAVGGKLLDAFPTRFDTVSLRPQMLDLPLRWARPRRVFVNSLSDLFHDDVPVEFIAKVFAVMSVTPQHTYQLLTKRHGRMRSMLAGRVSPRPGVSMPLKFLVDVERMRMGHPVLPDSRRADGTYAWPLPNVWLGVSAEDQARADLRIPALLATPAAVRWVSAEPLLGPLDIARYVVPGRTAVPYFAGARGDRLVDVPPLDWIVLGGESGSGARPLDTRWVTAVLGDTAGTGTATFVKQLGSVWAREHGRKGKGGDPAEWPEQLRVREYPDDADAA